MGLDVKYLDSHTSEKIANLFNFFRAHILKPSFWVYVSYCKTTVSFAEILRFRQIQLPLSITLLFHSVCSLNLNVNPDPFVPAPFQIFWILTQPIWILKPLSIPSWLILGRVVTTLWAVRYTFKYVTHCK